MLLEGKVTVITGAGSGLGRASALLFAREGARVVVNDVDERAGAETVALLEAAGAEALFVRADVSSDAEVEALFEAAVARFGRLDASFHNAGFMHPEDRGPEDTEVDLWDRVMAVNLRGVFLCCRHAIPRLLACGGGAIVNMSSVCAFVGSAVPQLAYTASKGGVLALTREVAAQYARQGIRVNALCPGPTRTPLLEYLVTDEERRDTRLEHIPLGRFGEADDVAKAALFLASDLSSYVTGAALLVDGGLSATYLTHGP